MATHFKRISSRLGGMRVLGPASTPWGGGQAKIQIQAKIHKGACQIQGVSYAEFPLYLRSSTSNLTST